MRRIFPLLLILLLLCGCGGNRDAAAPEDADRLVIFTARSAAVYDDAVREFERRTGIWVEVHPADDALPLLEQIAAGQRCDLLLGVTPDCLSACGELFAPYAPEAAADIPDAYRDSADRWTPFSLLPVVLIYNDQLVQRNVPDSWSSLTSSAWRGRIACPDPTVSATGCTALEAMTQALDGEAEQALADSKMGSFLLLRVVPGMEPVGELVGAIGSAIRESDAAGLVDGDVLYLLMRQAKACDLPIIRERLSGRSIQSTLEEQAEDLDEERELLDTDVEDVEAVEDLETLVVDETSEDLHDED